MSAAASFALVSLVVVSGHTATLTAVAAAAPLEISDGGLARAVAPLAERVVTDAGLGAVAPRSAEVPALASGAAVTGAGARPAEGAASSSSTVPGAGITGGAPRTSEGPAAASSTAPGGSTGAAPRTAESPAASSSPAPGAGSTGAAPRAAEGPAAASSTAPGAVPSGAPRTAEVPAPGSPSTASGAAPRASDSPAPAPSPTILSAGQSAPDAGLAGSAGPTSSVLTPADGGAGAASASESTSSPAADAELATAVEAAPSPPPQRKQPTFTQWWFAVGPSWTVATDLLGGGLRVDLPFAPSARHTPALSLGAQLQYGVGGTQRLLLAFPALLSVRIGLSEAGVQLIPAAGGALYRMARGATEGWGGKVMGALTLRMPFTHQGRVGLLLGGDVLVGDGVAVSTTLGLSL